MQFGSATQYVFGCKRVTETRIFFEKLGFRMISEHTQPYPWVQMTDNSIVIHLNQDGNIYFGVAYFNPDLNAQLPEFEKRHISIANSVKHGNFYQQVVFFSPDNFGVSMINYNYPDLKNRPLTSLLNLPQSEWETFRNYPNATLGIFGECAIPVKNLAESAKWWTQFNFKPQLEQMTPYPWGIYSDGLNLIGLHETGDFKQPSLTYFAKDMESRLNKLRFDGLTIHDFKGTGSGSSHGIIYTPDDQPIFLFGF